MIKINGKGDLGWPELREVFFDQECQVTLTAAAVKLIEDAVRFLGDFIATNPDVEVYGVNTGFGKMAHTKISPEKQHILQENLILSSAVGVGKILPENVSRLIVTLKINALAQGYSGVRVETISALVKLLNHKIYPCIPEKGSVGASGDLAPLAHLGLVLLGQGSCQYQGKIISAQEALQLVQMPAIKLQQKEGLGIINGTQVSTAIGLAALFKAEFIFKTAIIAGALTTLASRASAEPFSAIIQEIRRQPGQIKVAKLLRDILSNYHENNHAVRVQDPYSLRCQPQVMGACLDNIGFAADILLREANAVTDNPLLILEKQAILIGGNFHAEPVAFAADILALAIAEIGSLSERRIDFLIDPNINELPAFLINDSGLNSGFMVAHVVAAALASENKFLAHPVSVDNIDTSAGQEDHVSMATLAARRLHLMLDNAATIIAIELIAACQSSDLAKVQSFPPVLGQTKALVRQVLPYLEKDTSIAAEIESIKQKVMAGDFSKILDQELGLNFFEI